MTVSCKQLWGAAGVLLALLLLTDPVQAQDGKDEVRLEAIQVSAQKREENVQEVPMSVGVVTELQLEETRTSELSDLGRNIPNLYISSSGSPGTYTFVGIRGRINSTIDVEPTVTVLVDGVPYDDYYSMGNNLLFDVERVEVLRGSQSTLYGMNSSGGIINVVTREPGQDKDVKAFAEGGYGPSWDGSWRLGTSASGPLVEERLSGGIAFSAQGQGGYVKNVHTGDRYNEDRTFAARGNLVWTLSEAWKIFTGVAYSDLQADNGFLRLPFDQRSASLLGQNKKAWQSDIDWEGNTTVKTLAPNLKINYDGGPVDVIAVTAYRNTNQEFDFDLDQTPRDGGYARFKNELETFSQELRVQSDNESESPLQWMAGYFYSAFDRHLTSGMAPRTSLPLMALSDADYTGYSNAFFGQTTYRVLDQKLGLTLGVRQEWTQREAESRVGAFGETSKTDSQFLPKVAVDYRISPEAMVYASVTQGWRSGGVNPYSANSSNLTYEKEISWTYEAGAKTQWLDNRLLFNFSGFYTDYEDFQDKNRNTPFDVWLANVPKVRMIGFETEVDAMLTESLQLTGFLGYVKARYVDYPDPIAGNFDDNTVISVPDFNANLALKYSFWEHYYVRPSLQGIGTIYWDRENKTKQDPYMTVNFKAGYVKDAYEIYLFGENLTNKYAFTEANEDPITGGAYVGTPISPLKVGIGGNIRF